MRIDVNEQGCIVLEEVYNGITLKTAELNIAMRDEDIEMSIPDGKGGHSRFCVRMKERAIDNEGIPVTIEYKVESATEPAAVPAINIIFDGPPDNDPPHFVEVEADSGKSIAIGNWVNQGKYWALRITASDLVNQKATAPALALATATALALAPAIAKAAEQGRWQKAIYSLLTRLCPVDGSGCDSGDPLDVTTIGQAIGYAEEGGSIATDDWLIAHTPGPWKWDTDSNDKDNLVGANGIKVLSPVSGMDRADLGIRTGPWNTEEAKANAYLVANASEMYKEIIRLRKRLFALERNYIVRLEEV